MSFTRSVCKNQTCSIANSRKTPSDYLHKTEVGYERSCYEKIDLYDCVHKKTGQEFKKYEDKLYMSFDNFLSTSSVLSSL